VRVMRARSAASSSCSGYQHREMRSFSARRSAVLAARSSTYMGEDELDQVEGQLLCVCCIRVRARRTREPGVYRRGDGAWPQTEGSARGWCCSRWGAAGCRSVWHQQSWPWDMYCRELSGLCRIVGLLKLMGSHYAAQDMFKKYAGCFADASSVFAMT
jgi:hypothetical protein